MQKVLNEPADKKDAHAEHQACVLGCARENDKKGRETEDLAARCNKIITSQDYYEMLKLARSASRRQIQKQYRKLALELHPDKARVPEATRAFQRLSEAFRCLSDESKRTLYDECGNYAEYESRFGDCPSQEGPGECSQRVVEPRYCELLQLLPFVLMLILAYVVQVWKQSGLNTDIKVKVNYKRQSVFEARYKEKGHLEVNQPPTIFDSSNASRLSTNSHTNFVHAGYKPLYVFPKPNLTFPDPPLIPS